MTASAGIARQTPSRSLRAVAINACIVRYKLDQPVGTLYLVAAALDPFVYAGTIYFVLATIFGRDDPSRFHLLLLGVIAFRWTLSCLIHALNLHVIRERLSETSRYGYIGSIIAVVAPPTLAFALALSLALGWSIVADIPGRSLDAIWTLPGVILFQLLANCILVIAIDALRRARIVMGQAPIIAAATIIWFLSPFMYRLDDIPVSASLLLTSYNPVSHVIAAYQNAYWYGHVPSLNVLPAATLAAIVAIVVYRRLRKPAARALANSKFAATPGNSPLLVTTTGTVPSLMVVRSSASFDTPQVFKRWQGKIGDFRGSGLARLILAARGVPRREIRQQLIAIQESSGVGRLFDQDLSIYPDWALDQLALSMALPSFSSNIVLQGLLNAVSAEFAATAWRRIETEAESGRLISVVADRPIPLPPNAVGWYRVIGPSGVIAEGKLHDGAVKLSTPFGA